MEYNRHKGLHKEHRQFDVSSKQFVSFVLHLVLFVLLSQNVPAQGGSPFFNEIQAFKKEDSHQRIHREYHKNKINIIAGCIFRRILSYCIARRFIHE